MTCRCKESLLGVTNIALYIILRIIVLCGAFILLSQHVVFSKNQINPVNS